MILNLLGIIHCSEAIIDFAMVQLGHFLYHRLLILEFGQHVRRPSTDVRGQTLLFYCQAHRS